MASLEDIMKENADLKAKLAEMEEALKKYTNGERHQRYYDTHKEEIKSRAKAYMNKIKAENPEKIKEWRRNAYLKAKAKKVEEDSTSK
jgi:ribosomal protein L29